MSSNQTRRKETDRGDHGNEGINDKWSIWWRYEVHGSKKWWTISHESTERRIESGGDGPAKPVLSQKHVSSNLCFELRIRMENVHQTRVFGFMT